MTDTQFSQNLVLLQLTFPYHLARGCHSTPVQILHADLGRSDLLERCCPELFRVFLPNDLVDVIAERIYKALVIQDAIPYPSDCPVEGLDAFVVILEGFDRLFGDLLAYMISRYRIGCLGLLTFGTVGLLSDRNLLTR